MDRSWINVVRISDEYERGVEEFIQFAQRNAIISGHDGAKIRCLCVNCLAQRAHSIYARTSCNNFVSLYYFLFIFILHII